MILEMKNKTPKTKLTLILPVEVITRAKIMAAQMRIPVSHLIEGLIMGAQIVSTPKQDLEEKN